jgi:cyclopropane-fatty-acyl-phospholipid synthase
MERCSRCARRRAWRARFAPPASWGSSGRTSLGCSRSTTSTPRSTCSPTSSPRRCTDRSEPARACGAVRVWADAAAPCPGGRAAPRGRRHSPARYARAVRHRYDVSNEFSRSSSPRPPAMNIEPCRSPPARREDAGGGPARKARARLRQARTRARRARASSRCGWGSFATHDAATRGTEMVGITLSEPQARFAQHRAAQEGVADRVEIRVMDYRQLTGERFDAVVSIGMVEHVGSVQIDLCTAARRSA